MRIWRVIAALGLGLLVGDAGALLPLHAEAQAATAKLAKGGKQKLLKVDGTVTGVTDTELILTGKQKKGPVGDLILAVTPTTTVYKGNAAATIADVLPGNSVQVRYARDAATGGNTAQTIRVRAEKALDVCEPLIPTPVPQ
jgi:hypothetical protein